MPVINRPQPPLPIVVVGRAALFVCVLLSVAGCGASDGRQAVSGEVLVDGEPLEDGIIRFEPLPGTPGNGSGTAIVGGKYSLPRERGLFPGRFQVRIESHQLTGEMYNDVIRGLQPELLPVKFAGAGPGEVEVEPGHAATFNFQLEKAGYLQNDGSVRPLK